MSQRQIFNQIYQNGNFTQLTNLINSHRLERKQFLSRLVDLIQINLDDTVRSLEIGCGTGIDSLILTERTDCLAYGVDLSFEALRVAQRFNQKFGHCLDLVNCDGFSLPFADQTFGLVFSQGVLEHVGDELSFIAEQIRVLKTGGKLVINVPQRYTVYTIVKHYKIRQGTWQWGYEKEYSYGQLRQYGKLSNLVEKDVIGCRYWLHPCEPMWVMKSLWDKVQKINPARNNPLFQTIKSIYEDFWKRLEGRFGYYFMRDIVIIFEKL